MEDEDNKIVYVIGFNKEGRYNIYKTTKFSATEKGQLNFTTWMQARRHLKQRLANARSDIMTQLFVVDKEARLVDKLRETHCRDLPDDQPVFEEEAKAM